MSEEAAAASTTEEEPSSESEDSGLVEVWTELDRDHEGVSLTVYEEYEDGETVVRDESWWTWAEFTGMSTEALNISETGSTALTALDGGNLLTADNILDVVFETDLTLVDFGEIKGDIDGEPVYDEMEIPSEDAVQAELTEAM
jgi:hypothetical protein